MTTISPRSTIAPVAPLPLSQTAEAPKQEEDAASAPQGSEVALKPNWLFDQITAESEQRYQRGLIAVELLQEGLKKMAAETSLKTEKAMLAAHDKTLSVPFTEPEQVTGDLLKKIIEDGAKRMKDLLGYVPAEYGFMYEGSDILYQVKSDGSATKRYSWAAETKGIYDRAKEERAGIRARLASGIYERQIDEANARSAALSEKLGPLSEDENRMLAGIKPFFSFLT